MNWSKTGDERILGNYEVIIQEIPYASAWYASAAQLRDEVLRKPLGLVLSAKDVEGEDKQIHIAAIEGSIVVGTVILKALSATHIKFRQMAVSTTLQRSGAGSKLMQFAETLAEARKFQHIELHARRYAQGFYEKLGYEAIGKEFTEVGLPTIKMVKTL